MKSKAKLDKIKAQKAAPKAAVPENWLLMSPKEVTVAELKAVLEEKGEYDLQIWPEAGVLEVVLGEKASLDCETIDPELGDEFSDSFLKQHQVKSLFYITLPQMVYDQGRAVLLILKEACDGLVCGDTEDFNPQL